MRLPSSFVLILLLLILAGLLLCGIALVPDQSAAPPHSPADPRRSPDPLVSDGLVVAKDSGWPSLPPLPPSLDGALALPSEHDWFLQVSLDGTVQLKDLRSRDSQWKFSTDSPLLHLEWALSSVDDDECDIVPGKEQDLLEYEKCVGPRKRNFTMEERPHQEIIKKLALTMKDLFHDTSSVKGSLVTIGSKATSLYTMEERPYQEIMEKLVLTMKELVHDAPIVNGSVVTIGSKTTSLYHIDAESGELLYKDHLPGTWLATGIHRVGEDAVLSKLSNGRNARTANKIVTIIRTDYCLNSSKLGKPLWSMHTSTISASMSSRLGGNLESTFPQQVKLPVILDDGRILRIPEPGSLDTPMLSGKPHETNTSYCTGIIPVTGQNSTEASLYFGSQAETYQLPRIPDGKPIYVNTSQESAKSGNICPLGSCDAVKPSVIDTFLNFMNLNLLKFLYGSEILLSTSGNSSEGPNTAKLDFSRIHPRAIFGILVSWVLFLAFWWRFRELRRPDKPSSDIRVRQSVVPKKRRVRKSGNIKNTATISNHDELPSFEKENAETNGYTYIRKNALYLFNLIRYAPADDGNWVGLTFVSNSEIGRGSNGTVVFDGVYNGQRVAVKRLLRADLDMAFKEIQNLIASHGHRNIVQWHGVDQDLNFVYLSLERCSCSLSDLIQLFSDSPSQTSNSISDYKVKLECAKGVNKELELWKVNGFPSSALLKLMKNMVKGLAHLHKLGIIHRDLKPRNVLISNDQGLTAKLSDMGMSKRLLEDTSALSHHATGYGSSGWRSPEQLLHGRQTRAMDLFSLGCILFFCITKGKHPFGGVYERDLNIVNDCVDLFLVEDIPEAVHLLSLLLHANPNMRPTAEEVLHHPFFWKPEKRLSFLRDLSDRVKSEDGENESELVKALENISSVAFGGRWSEKLDAALIEDMGRYRKYKFGCTSDLLRLIRNKLNHYKELPKELQEILGAVPDGFDSYFSTRFPRLLMEAYKVASIYCRDEEGDFSQYFSSSRV